MLFFFIQFQAKDNVQDQKITIDTSKYKEIIRVACVGDSITAGNRIKNAKEKYPACLGALLGGKWEVKNFGSSGATLLRNGDKPYNRTGMYKKALEYNPHVIIIKLGTNDSKKNNWRNKDDFVKDYNELIESFASLKTKPSPKIWLCTPCPTKMKGGAKIDGTVIKDEILPKIKEVVKNVGCQIIDIHDALTDEQDILADAVHPNAKGAKLIAEQVCEALTGKKPK